MISRRQTRLSNVMSVTILRLEIGEIAPRMPLRKSSGVWSRKHPSRHPPDCATEGPPKRGAEELDCLQRVEADVFASLFSHDGTGNARERPEFQVSKKCLLFSTLTLLCPQVRLATLHSNLPGICTSEESLLSRPEQTSFEHVTLATPYASLWFSRGRCTASM